jgi:hypothetical protein
MIEKVVQKAFVFHGIDYSALAMHLLQVFRDVLVKLYVPEDPVKKPGKKKPGLLVQLERVK